MITTVVFDLDDTLYDELDYCKSGFNAAAQFLSGLPNLPSPHTADDIFSTLWDQFSTGDHTKTFNGALKKLKIEYDEGTIRNLVSIYRNHKPAIKLPDETQSILDILSPKYTMAILSDGFLPAQQLKVHALGIERYFDAIIYTESLGRACWKPSTAGFEYLLKQLKKRPQNCVYVADNAEKDFIAPNKLGFATIQLIGPSHIHNDPPQQRHAAPDLIITSINQLPNALYRL
jgi:putative hydrolase of the HAD superfamily